MKISLISLIGLQQVVYGRVRSEMAFVFQVFAHFYAWSAWHLGRTDVVGIVIGIQVPVLEQSRELVRVESALGLHFQTVDVGELWRAFKVGVGLSRIFIGVGDDSVFFNDHLLDQGWLLERWFHMVSIYIVAGHYSWQCVLIHQASVDFLGENLIWFFAISIRYKFWALREEILINVICATQSILTLLWRVVLLNTLFIEMSLTLNHEKVWLLIALYLRQLVLKVIIELRLLFFWEIHLLFFAAILLSLWSLCILIVICSQSVIHPRLYQNLIALSLFKGSDKSGLTRVLSWTVEMCYFYRGLDQALVWGRFFIFAIWAHQIAHFRSECWFRQKKLSMLCWTGVWTFRRIFVLREQNQTWILIRLSILSKKRLFLLRKLSI